MKRRSFLTGAVTAGLAGCTSLGHESAPPDGQGPTRIEDCGSNYTWSTLDGSSTNTNRAAATISPSPPVRELVDRTPYARRPFVDSVGYNVADGMLIVVDATGLEAVDATTGETIWSQVRPTRGSQTPLNQVRPPVTTCETVVTQFNNTIAGFSLDGGEPLWDDTMGIVPRTANVPAAGQYALVPRISDIVALDVTDGTRAWEFTYREGLEQWDGGGTSGIAIQNGRAYVTTGDSEPGGGTTFAIDIESEKVLWSNPESSSRSRPSVADGTLFVRRTSGGVDALDLETGEREFQIDDTSQTLDLKTFTVDEQRGQFYDVHPHSEWIAAYAIDGGERRWQSSLEGRINAAPLATGDALVVPSDDLLLFDPETGALEGRIDLEVRYPLAADESRLFAGTADGTFVVGGVDHQP